MEIIIIRQFILAATLINLFHIFCFSLILMTNNNNNIYIYIIYII